MTQALAGETEAKRLAALRSYAILDTAAEESFDALTKLAAHILDTPIALVSLVDDNRQWFKSHYGLGTRETSRDVAFCSHVVASGEPLVVRDATEDDRFSDNPLVVGDPKIRFYAGIPLRTPDGFVLGTLCAIDRRPRELTASQHEMLSHLTRQACDQLELRRTNMELLRFATDLEQNQRERHNLFDAAQDLVCVGGIDGYLRMANPAFMQVLGYTQAQLFAQPLISLVHPDDINATAVALGELTAGKKITGFENRIRTADGRYVPLSWNATWDTPSASMYASARDNSHLKQAQRDLASAHAQALRENMAKTAFLTHMSHELRTPLTSVVGFSHLLLTGHADSLTHQQVTYVSRIKDNGDHLLKLINDVLDLAKVEAGVMDATIDSVSVADVVQETVAILEPLVRSKNIYLVTEVPDHLATIATDRSRLKQVLLNLVANAVKFTKTGGVTVRVACGKQSNLPLRIDVVDTGIGIPPTRFDAIFRAFQQVDKNTVREFGGTGLGLPISRAIAHRLGFEISFTSELRVGSTFSLHLHQ